MDHARLDSVARLLARPARSRRSALKLFGAAILGGSLTHVSPEVTAAGCRRAGRRCRRASTCCPGLRCRKRRCTCPSGRTNCRGACVNTGTDDLNCGACGNVCPTGSTCQEGACRCPDGNPTCGGGCCLAGQTCCNGSCRQLDRDEGACGSCDVGCDSNEICSGGICCLSLNQPGCDNGGRCCNGAGNIICFNNVCRQIRDTLGSRQGE